MSYDTSYFDESSYMLLFRITFDLVSMDLRFRLSSVIQVSSWNFVKSSIKTKCILISDSWKSEPNAMGYLIKLCGLICYLPA